jgi:hypothetical protein
MDRKMLARCVCTLLGGALLLGGFAFAENAAPKPAKLAAKGTYTFGGSKGPWSGELTPTKTPGVYDVQYVSAHGGNKKMTYAGQIKTDLKTEISGEGKSTGGGGNGTFKFSGKFGADGVAKCSYSEVGGQRNRSGTLTVDSIK